MADDLKHSTTISKKDRSFPDYLDFEKLRSEGIEYLGQLAGQIWTDHNVHDPGITILEMLCYALLDLGYRTQLPLEDILARHPDDVTPDNNFFTPAQILACNPLTVTDFRKLLIDIKEVRNAWLEPATDIIDICRYNQQNLNNDIISDYDVNRGEGNSSCQSFLNGLYHVYLDLEKDIDSYGKPGNDFANETQANDYKNAAISQVKKALMEHRNFCEDFADIFILCKQPMGVCAEIELEDSAKAEDVYVTAVEKLRDFFTPVPRFYTLQQLLEKGIAMEEIFAGRPFDHTQSHGFVDVEEFEALKLKKEIHTSDVYNVLFNVPGVRSVSNLSLRSCDGTFETSDWKFPIKENHVPEFSSRCSGFRFMRNGMPFPVDVKKYQGLFELNFSHSGKVLYESPSPYLDAQIPKGNYRSDLADYYSIQNEFPRVYAIEEGGLSDNAPKLRKAQALQLKGYLLFFDQLLANYLTQLGNLRSLFALDSPEDEKEQHTYFNNQLNTVPELKKLLRFPATENGGNGSPDSHAGTLVFPMDKNKLLTLKESDRLKYFDPEQEPPYVFASQAEKDIAVSQIRDDFYNDDTVSIEFITKNDDCVFYYILTSSDNIGLVSKKYFKSIDEAREHAASVKYIGAFSENYRSFVDSRHHFSFAIEMNLASFAEYLQLLVEDRTLYLERRQDFLKHLLARFAEKFTDYALLTFGNISNVQVEESKIEATEKFLSKYDDLSSNRGKAFDYRTNGWNNRNVSGFEKRVKSLSGIENWKRRSLCNFEVHRYDEEYTVNLIIEDREFFTLRETYFSRKEAREAAKTFFLALSDRERYRVTQQPTEQTYIIAIGSDERTMGTYQEKYETEEEAYTAIKHLHRLFSGNAALFEHIIASDFAYRLQLKDYEGKVVRTSSKSYKTVATAKLVITQLKQGVNDEERWQKEEDSKRSPDTLYRIQHPSETPYFIDPDAFKIDIDNTLVGKPDRFSYDLLDNRNSFKFRPLKEFDSQEQVREHWRQLLAWMANAENYKVHSAENDDTFSLQIVVDDEEIAVYSEKFTDRNEALRIQSTVHSIIQQNLYTLSLQKVPDRWKFSFRLGIDRARPFTFESIEEYQSEEEAFAAAEGFTKSLSNTEVWKYKEEDGFRLVPVDTAKDISTLIQVHPDKDREVEELRMEINKQLSLQTEVNRLLEEPDPEEFSAGVELDELSEQGLFVYRLIDKDTIPARFNKSFTDRDNAEKILKSLRKVSCEKYFTLEICLGGSKIISERRNESTGTVWYHYLIRSRNRLGESGDEPVLFESVQGYRTKEEVEKAFRENYLKILELASTSENYGSVISPEEKLVHQPVDYSDNEAIVFIPQATREEWGEETNKKLIFLAKSYPIRVVDRNSDRFYTLFFCEEKPDKLQERFCRPEEENPVYYFRLYEAGSDEGEKENLYWLSTRYFDTPEEARRGYRFFRMLLCYPGNFFVRCDPCEDDVDRYQICLREVLAESTARFKSLEEAWGKEGVQKFICVSQSERAFHPYRKEPDRCFTFYVACADNLVYHPCHYDSPKKRDEIISKLYKEVLDSHKNQAWRIESKVNEKTEREEYLLLNERGSPFARIKTKDSNYQVNICAELVAFLEKVNQEKIEYTTDENDLSFAHDPDGESGISIYVHDEADIDEWKKSLHRFACYYPIVKRLDEKTGKYEYCVEIKLPGFSSCDENFEEDKPCGCSSDEQQTKPNCYVAWKSRCCFETCEEALSAWQAIIQLLLQPKNYRPLFDCDCYDFSIALHYNKQEGTVSRNAEFLPPDSEIVALNPQCYSNPNEVCAAIERSWKLINAEGLHVAEHILLRPRCKEDCRCDLYSAPCENKTGCEFTWSEPKDDPCADLPDVCFIPGVDPYSFIATVAMPAWPARFRKPENRRLLEHILYREAPAHVLLRVLWLAPHDFCRFESKYRQWSRWLARKEACLEDFSGCDFLEFLFNRNFECLEECDVCKCRDDDKKSETDFCSETWGQEAVSDPYKFLNQINNLYCWREQDCGEQIGNGILHSRLSAEGREDEGSAAEAETEEAPLKPKPQVVNSRMARYRSAVDKVLEVTNQHTIAEKAKAFVTDPRPSAQRTSNLLMEIVENKKPEDGKVLTKTRVVKLLQSVLCYYLDKVCFNGKDLEHIKALRQSLEALRKAKPDVDPVSIYEYWEPEQVRLYEPDTDFAAIRRIITGEGDN